MTKHHARSKPEAPGSLVIDFYRLWHGRFKLKGAGWLIRLLAPYFQSLQNYPLSLDEGQTITLDFTDISAFCWLHHSFGESFEETGLLQAMATVITEDSVVWDVGANCGKVCYHLAKETPAKQVVFFEPIASMYEITLCATATFSKVSGMNVALSNSNSQVGLFIPTSNSTMAEIRTGGDADHAETQMVQCKIGDSLVSMGVVPAPNVIKIDTEGHELMVLDGLREVITTHRPVIFLEHLSLSDLEIREAASNRYEIFSVSNTDGSLTKGIHRSKGHNTALLPKES